MFHLSVSQNSFIESTILSQVHDSQNVVFKNCDFILLLLSAACGEPVRSGRIVNGTETVPGAYPWAVGNNKLIKIPSQAHTPL